MIITPVDDGNCDELQVSLQDSEDRGEHSSAVKIALAVILPGFCPGLGVSHNSKHDHRCSLLVSDLSVSGDSSWA